MTDNTPINTTTAAPAPPTAAAAAMETLARQRNKEAERVRSMEAPFG